MTNSLRDNIPRLVFGLLTAIWVVQTAYTRVWDTSLVLALVAVWVAVYEVQRDNTVLIDVQSCSASGRRHAGENNDQFYSHFTIVVRNKGVSLFQPTMSLSFVDAGGGRLSLPLRIAKEHQVEDGRGEFSRGMLAMFEWKSYSLHPGDDRFLEQLKDPDVQDARLNIYSQYFLASSIKLGGRTQRLTMRWNHFADRINRRFERKIRTISGKELAKDSGFLPIFALPGNEVMGFIGMLKQRPQNIQLPGQS